MTVLDAYAVLALFRGEPAAGPVRELLESDADSSLTVLGVAEVLDHLVRLAGVTDEEAVLDVAQLGLAEPRALDAAAAMQAGLLRARHYHRRDRAVSLADCVAAATAQAWHRPLATADPHLLALCVDEGIAVLALPDSSGVTWRPLPPGS
jgi:PIN domain nuclease of toxin-antitoxin system